MRNLHSHLYEEFGRESVFLLWQSEKYEKKMADFCNHRRFSLKCLKYDVIPVSIRLKTTYRTAKGLEIIRKTERKLLNEHIRFINNSLELYMYEKEAIVQQLEDKLDHNSMEECNNFIKRVIEVSHQRVLEWQKRKFELLYQRETGGHSNQGNHSGCAQRPDTSKWVKNLLDKPLTEAQTSLLAHGPDYAIIPKNPPKEEYIAAIEHACQKLKEGDADELKS